MALCVLAARSGLWNYTQRRHGVFTGFVLPTSHLPPPHSNTFATITLKLIKSQTVGHACRIFFGDMSGNCEIWIDSCQGVLCLTNGPRETCYPISIFRRWHSRPVAGTGHKGGAGSADNWAALVPRIVGPGHATLTGAGMSDWSLIEVTLSVTPYIFNGVGRRSSLQSTRVCAIAVDRCHARCWLPSADRPTQPSRLRWNPRPIQPPPTYPTPALPF